MSDPLVVELIEVINAEIRIFHQLLELMEQERKALVGDDVEGIEACVAAKTEVARRAQELEEARQRAVGALALQLDLEPGNPSLARLIEVVERAPGAELAQMRATLIELNQKIRAANESNAFLIRQSMRYTGRCLNILTGVPAGRGLYGQFGRERLQGSARSLLNETA